MAVQTGSLDLKTQKAVYDVAEVAQNTADNAITDINDLDLFINGGYTTDVESDRSGVPAYEQSDIVVDNGLFYEKVEGDYGEYTFTYNGSGWLLNGTAVELNQYGITLAATPQANDTITVELIEVSGSMVDINNQYEALSSKVDDNDVRAESAETEIQEAQNELQTAIEALQIATESIASIANIVSTRTAGMGFTPKNGLVLYNGDYALTYTSVYSDQDISIDRDAFCDGVENAFGEFAFVYTDSEWVLNENIVDLTDYGITLTATPAEDDYITVNLEPDNATDNTGFKLQLAAQTINFIDGALGNAQDILASVSGNALVINNAVISSQLMFGNYAFIPRSNGNMALKYLG